MLITFETEQMVMTVDESEQRDLRAMRETDPQRFNTDDTLAEMLIDLTSNDEFDWIPEGVTGDLTSAPMLGICGEVEEKPDGYADNWVGSGLRDWGSGEVLPVLYRWAFMDYAVQSPQGALADTGRAVWQGGWVLERGQEGKPDDRVICLRREW